MAEFPALPLWTDAYLGDCHHLDDAEHGRYIQILILMWRSPQCRIPNDDEWIAKRLHRSVEAMQTHIRPLIQTYMQTDGNWITQKRLQKEWHWCQEKRKKNTEAANTRWIKPNQSSERTTERISKRNAPYPHQYKESNGEVFKGQERRSTITTSEFSTETWGKHVVHFKASGTWPSGMGPNPTEKSCKAPIEILTEHGYATVMTEAKAALKEFRVVEKVANES